MGLRACPHLRGHHPKAEGQLGACAMGWGRHRGLIRCLNNLNAKEGGQIRTQPSLTTPTGTPRKRALVGLRTASTVHSHVPDIFCGCPQEPLRTRCPAPCPGHTACSAGI